MGVAHLVSTLRQVAPMRWLGVPFRNEASGSVRSRPPIPVRVEAGVRRTVGVEDVIRVSCSRLSRNNPCRQDWVLASSLSTPQESSRALAPTRFEVALLHHPRTTIARWRLRHERDQGSSSGRARNAVEAEMGSQPGSSDAIEILVYFTSFTTLDDGRTPTRSASPEGQLGFWRPTPHLATNPAPSDRTDGNRAIDILQSP
jgi:hypothetical protein